MEYKPFLAAMAVVFLGNAAQAETMVREVEVTVDMAAITNPKAAAYWGRVAEDLEGAIIARLGSRIADDGASITIDLDEVSLANTFELAANIADSRLAGSVAVTSRTDNTVFDGYDLAITQKEAIPYYVEGTDLTKITSDSAENYQALIGAFANSVVDHLK